MRVQDQSGACASNPASSVSLDCIEPRALSLRRLAFPRFPPPSRDWPPRGRSPLFGGSALACLAVLALGLASVAHAQAPASPVVKGNVDERKVGTYVLPDPLTLQSGAPVTDAPTWAHQRRAEVLELFRAHQFGRTPTTVVPMKTDTWEAGVASFGGLAKRAQTRLTFPGHAGGPTVRVVIYTPAAAQGPVPVLLHIGFSPNVLVFDDPGVEEGMAWNVREKKRVPDRQATLLAGFDPKPFLEMGLAVAHVYYGDIEPDFDGGAGFGVRSLFGPQGGDREPDEWGAIGAWGWGLSRVVDYLSSEPAIDASKIALSGASRLGKTTMWAAAQEPRVALVMPVISGEGGGALSRRDYGETIAAITDSARYHYWFAPRYRTYADRVGELPVDSHMLLSLIAPRPMLLVTGEIDTWSDPRGEFLAAQAAAPVYALYGKAGPGPVQPPAETPPTGDLAVYMHKDGHKLLPGDLVVMADFMARQFAGAPAKSDPAAANAVRKANRNMPTAWWAGVKDRPDAWFAGPEAKVMADNILSWQDPATGGWPLMNTVGEPNIGDPAAIGPWGTRAALIKATVNEMRFLARVQQVRPDTAHVQAIDRGLGFILAAQYPSGGWPHSWPVFVNAYDHQATFKDDEMVDLMTLLREVATAPGFRGLPSQRRAAAQAAFDRGLDFILKSQIRVDGKLTAWCAQHDEVNYEPRPARKFEPVSISGGESAGVLLLLMSLERPSPAVEAAIRAGAAWYRQVQIKGVRVDYADGDRIVRQDPTAPPLWARFYEIGTNRPIFAGRDGVIRYQLAQIEKERRGGYGWYGDWGGAVQVRYAEWARTHGD